MAVLKKYDLHGKNIGEVTVSDDLLASDANLQMIKDYLVAIRANARQWSASTKGRAEVNHSGQKPHPQKGTGRARQGYLGAPQYKGGGRVHSPRPKFDMHVRINKKERRAAIKHLLSEKITAQKVHVLQYSPLKKPHTKSVVTLLKHLDLVGKRVLILGEGAHSPEAGAVMSKYETLVQSMGNVAKLEFMLMPNVSGYDLAVCQDLIILEPAVDELLIQLGG